MDALITSLPNNITNQCTGRTNSSRFAPHFMRLAMGNFASASVTMASSNSTVFLPSVVIRATSFSALPSFSAVNSEAAIPFFSANASAALVGWPSLSNAIAAGGPQTTSSLDGVSLARFSTSTAKRRGAAKGLIAVKESSAAIKLFSIVSANEAIKFFNAFGGNSSVPSSTKKSADIIFPPLRQAVHFAGLQEQVGNRGLCGYQNRLGQRHGIKCARVK